MVPRLEEESPGSGASLEGPAISPSALRTQRADGLRRNAPTLAFAAVIVAALVLYVVFGRSQWFFLDDWDFLANRTLSPSDLLRPHNEHWSTLPILAYRVLWHVFGIRTYFPYQLIAILLHLTAATLLWIVMRRAEVSSWVATSAASLFALFGAGLQDVLSAFQMAWGATLVLGLTHLILADHDGRLDRRDVLGLVAGIAGLMCSGVAVTMVAAVGLAVLIRRGWRAALFHIAPLAMLYLVWWLAFGQDQYLSPSPIRKVPRFVWTGLSATFDEMGQLPGVGWALAVVLVAGLVMAWRNSTWDQLRRRAAVPVSLLVGAVVYLAIVGFGRAWFFGPEFARTSRYLHVVAALSLPAIAVATDALLRRWRIVGIAAAALFVVGIPGNIDLIVRYGDSEACCGSPRALTLALPCIVLAHHVPSRLQPMPDLTRVEGVTIGWLQSGVRSGRIPDPGRIDSLTAAQANFRLSLLQSQRSSSAERCEDLVHPVVRTLAKGESVQFKGGGGQVLVSAPRDRWVSVTYNPADGRALTATRGPLTIKIASKNPYPFLASLCE